VRLHLPSRADTSSAERRRGRDHQVRQRPAAVLTAWLRQGLRNGICPLCRVAHKADREYNWQFFDGGADQGDAIDAVSKAYGFCAEHVTMLSRIDTEGMKSTLAISTMFADAFAGIVNKLESLDGRGEFARAPCPACANRDERVRAHARYLLDELATNPGLRSRFDGSPGLCFPHFEMVWHQTRTDEERAFVGRVQREGAARLLLELSEHVRKHDHKYRHEAKGPERDAWRRVVFMTAGWPAPSESAAQPEGTR
jgi:hypothetical protein